MPHDFTSFAQAAEYCALLALEQHEADHTALEKATRMIQKKAKDKIGEYQPSAGPFAAWSPLAESTKADRVSQGFAEDEPLLRTGEMRDSIETKVVDKEGYVGSDNDKAVWQELGTKTIPPRSFLGSTAAENIDAIIEIVGETVLLTLAGKKPEIDFIIGGGR